jgi:hypothetical protein
METIATCMMCEQVLTGGRCTNGMCPGYAPLEEAEHEECHTHLAELRAEVEMANLRVDAWYGNSDDWQEENERLPCGCRVDGVPWAHTALHASASEPPGVGAVLVGRVCVSPKGPRAEGRCLAALGIAAIGIITDRDFVSSDVEIN